MSNRETYPSSQSPLLGDLDGGAGDTRVTVVGWQNIPVDPATPTPEQQYYYDFDLNEWVHRLDSNISVTLGQFLTAGGQVISQGRKLSDDYEFSCAGVDFDVIVGWAYGFAFKCFLDGVGIPGTET